MATQSLLGSPSQLLSRPLPAVAALLTAALVPLPHARAQERVHFTYLWHMEQPIYWPDRQVGGADRYERANESLNRGGAHPQNNLSEIFGNADRVAAYQWRVRDSIAAMNGGESGAQISYSGGLIENLQSLGAANRLGYSSNWNAGYREARTWLTTASPSGQRFPRADIVLFPFHHALMPLVHPSTQRRQIQLYKAVYADAWGSGAPSVGFFPSEMAFSTTMIPALAAEGVQWSIVSSEKLSRACADWPVVLGSGGTNADPPNRADQVNPAQGAAAYLRLSIDRGCSPAEAFPFAMTPRRARHVDPATGQISEIIVVPSSQSLSWRDGYSPQGIAEFDTLQTRNPSNRPQLVVLAHDGDNAWGGGYSYYLEATPNRIAQARSAGYVPTVIQKYLHDHPVPADDLVHVEDGAWVNADGDFGAPQFINWNWPLLAPNGQIDIENGWHEDARNWAVITAAQNRVDTAEAIWRAQGNTFNLRKVLYPDATTNPVERAWHYFMGSLNSGYMYYGAAIDMEVKPSVACNNALRLANPVITAAGPAADTTPPTIWYPQRHPWNPGSVNFGPQYGYRQQINNGDFYIWSFVDDVSGLSTVTLKYRLDADGTNPLATIENETFAGGPGVGAWQTVTMTRRAFPASNVYTNPDINFFVMPDAIADQYWVKLTGIRSSLVDYYIEAIDTRGNVSRSPIRHVYVGDGQGGTPPGGGGGGGGGTPTDPVVTVAPSPPVAGQSVTVTYNPAGRNLASETQVFAHVGFNNWQSVLTPDLPMTRASAQAPWSVTLSLPITAAQLDLVFNNARGTWDNNGGQDWHIPVSGAQQPFVMDGNLDAGTTPVAQSGNRTLHAALRGDLLYIAGPNAGSGNDAFIYLAAPPGALRTANWGKAGQIASWLTFLAAENDNGFTGWFDHPAGVAVAQARGAVLEGTIDLRALLGPATFAPGGTINTQLELHLAFANFPTANGTSLLPGLQIPASSNNNTTLDATEYARFRLCDLLPGGCTPPPPTPCNPADIASVGGAPPADGLLTGDDFNAFIAAFAAGDARADITGIGGPPSGPDGLITGDDFNAFIAAFAQGCP